MDAQPHPVAARDPAEVYDALFVPALFAPAATIVADAAALDAGTGVLDVGCGTGALTEVVVGRVGAGGTVTAVDASPQMLAVARRKALPVRWVEGRAEALPFDDGQFDAVVSQFAMMFFDDRAQALREMRRVLRPRGSLTVAVCDAVDRSPGYARVAWLLQRLFGGDVAAAFLVPFALGDRTALSALCRKSGWLRAEVTGRTAKVRFASIDALVSAEHACMWTLGGLLDEAQFGRLRAEAHQELRPWTDSGGGVVFDLPMLLIRGRVD
jgi:SAM-dependent methyltransferase